MCVTLRNTAATAQADKEPCFLQTLRPHLNNTNLTASCQAIICLAMSEQRSWAAIARPIDTTDPQPQSPAAVAKKCRAIIVPKARASRSIAQTPLEGPRSCPSYYDAPPQPSQLSQSALSYISAPFPTSWYEDAMEALNVGPASPSAEEPKWHRVFNNARKQLFGKAFPTESESYRAYDEGLAELSTVVTLLRGLYRTDKANAHASLKAHSTGQLCAFCR
jgi:hypothetical protein